jgi:hypothetical protein
MYQCQSNTPKPHTRAPNLVVRTMQQVVPTPSGRYPFASFLDRARAREDERVHLLEGIAQVCARAGNFLGWCAGTGITSITAVQPLQVASWIELQT